jgi:heptosyltransferase-3
LAWFKRLWKEARLLWQLRKSRYNLIINLTEGDRGTLVAKVSGAKIRVGFVPKGRWQKKVYTHVIKHGPHVRHTVEKQLDALRRIGIFPGDHRDAVWNIPASVVDKMREKMGSQPFILVHPASRWKFKCYPVDKMRACVKALQGQGHRVVLTSGPDAEEIEMVQKLSQGLPVEVLAGKTSLHELGALIFLSQVLLCVDSVPLHMASALKKSVVVLFGPTSEITWGPWRNPHAIVLTQNFSCRPCYQDGCGGSKHSDCLATIPVSKVLDAVEERCITLYRS